MTKLSVVSTLYGSALYLPEFYARVCAAAAPIDSDFELVLVNDGSPDQSLAVALQLLATDSRLRIVDLSRNFGHHKAMMTGLAHAEGELIFLIDCDLEEPPEALAQFYALLESTPDLDVAYGVQIQRKGNLPEQFMGALYYKLLNRLTDHPLPPNLIVARLMRRRYVDQLLRFGESQLNIAGLWVATGFRQQGVPVHKGSRPRSSSSYHLGRKLSVVLRAVTSFSSKPLYAVLYAGLLTLLVAGVLGLVWLWGATRPASDSATVMLGAILASLWLLGGLILLSLGILGIYLSVIFTESKQRPYTIIRQIYQREKNANTAATGPSQPPS
jgi:putative glycosyltransferase